MEQAARGISYQYKCNLRRFNMVPELDKWKAGQLYDWRARQLHFEIHYGRIGAIVWQIRGRSSGLKSVLVVHRGGTGAGTHGLHLVH